MPSAQNHTRYKKYMVSLYNHAFETNHPKDHEFTNEELFPLRPEHVYAHFANMAYGTPSPSADDYPIKCRSSTLEFAKKAISNFMPNRLIAWNAQSLSGNPTRSAIVNDLIKRVKKEEVSTTLFDLYFETYTNTVLCLHYVSLTG